MALVTIRRSSSVQEPRNSDEAEKSIENTEDDVGSRVSKSLNECYFANKGAALVLGGAERSCQDAARSPARALPPPDIQHHLQAMFSLLRPEETLKMAVKLESAHAGRTRYLVVVCHGEEAALLGIDCNECTTVGLVLRVLADTSIKLDGDGGFSVCVCHQQHIFKPVSVQAMWSALQTLHRASGRARALNHFAGGASHAWCGFYDRHVGSDRSCLNEWHAMDCIESRRPPSPDSLRHKPRQRDETERVIRCTLKEIMMSVDLDEVTSKAIRGRLEDDLDMDLAEYKPFIDHEMLTILGQMDAPTEVFDHVYLGSEWNASNLEELQRNGVRHILNVTREIDNFFPGVFDYLNIRVYDDEKTDLLKHWDNTFKYINKARNEGSKVLVHCKMGISRSASVVIAYAMKAFNWHFDKALKHVKTKRNCIKPNTNFLSQLETYQGILDAMKNKEKLQRSKSETNLKSPKSGSKGEKASPEPTPLVQALTGSRRGRARSWAAGARLAAAHAAHAAHAAASLSLERLAETRHMLMPTAGGCYSVSPNQIIRLKEDGAPSVKHIVNEIESAACADRRDFRRSQRLHFGSPADPPSAADRSSDAAAPLADGTIKPIQASPSKSTSQKIAHSVFEPDRIHTWDPGEGPWPQNEDDPNARESDSLVESDSGIVKVKLKTNDAFLNLNHSADSDCRQWEEEPPPPSGPNYDCTAAAAAAASAGEAAAWECVRRGKDDLASIAEHEPRRAHNERKFNETCAILSQLASAAAAAARAERARVRGSSTWGGAGAAGGGAAGGAPGMRRRRASQPDLPRAVPPRSPAGLVRCLKQEFEARSEPGDSRRVRRTVPPGSGAVSVPAPVPPRSVAGRVPPAEDVSVRVLVGRYDRPPERRDPSKKCKVDGRRAPERPPPAPSVVAMPVDYSNVLVSTVMSKAQNKKQLQHGKTHPLTRLNLNRSNNRCSNPVYNTM